MGHETGPVKIVFAKGAIITQDFFAQVKVAVGALA